MSRERESKVSPTHNPAMRGVRLTGCEGPAKHIASYHREVGMKKVHYTSINHLGDAGKSAQTAYLSSRLRFRTGSSTKSTKNGWEATDGCEDNDVLDGF